MKTATIAINNEHIPIITATKLLQEEISKIETNIKEKIKLNYLGKQKKGEDNTTKILISTKKKNTPLAVLICSRIIAPHLVERGTIMAENIRNLIGNDLGEAIIRPISHGYLNKQSYVILPYCNEFSSWRPVRLLQRLWLQKPLLNWLSQATTKAVRTSPPLPDTSKSFSSMLEYLSKQRFINNNIQQKISHAIERIKTTDWEPKHTFAHNDFWLGNIMWSTQHKIKPTIRPHFTIIDWGGSNQCGYGIYDLIRLSRGLKLSNKALLREIITHSTALHCDIEDTYGHLLASLAYLHQNLECFPESRYIDLFNYCLERLDDAIHS